MEAVVEKNLGKILTEEYFNDLELLSEPINDPEALRSFWENVAKAVNKTFREMGCGKPIVKVFTEVVISDDLRKSTNLFFLLRDGRYVTAVSRYPVCKKYYDRVVQVTIEVFNKAKTLLGREKISVGGVK